MGPLHPERRDFSTFGSAADDPGPLFSPEDGVIDFAFISLWMAGSVAGLVTAALISQVPLFRSLVRRLRLRWNRDGSTPKHKPSGKPARNPSPQEALPMLADAIIGSSKSAVAKVFGPPQSAVISSEAPGPKPATFWIADTWYYPMRRNGPMAMAIRFTQDSARTVEFLAPPR